MILRHIAAAVFGLFSGAAISGAVFAFIAAIGVVPHMARRTKTIDRTVIYEEAIAFGGIFGCLTLVFDFQLPANAVFVAFLALLGGVFFGVLVMSLAETLDVIPIFSKRLAIKDGVFWFVLAIAMGKTAGALMYFLVSGFERGN